MANNGKNSEAASDGAGPESPLKQLATVMPGDVVEIFMEDSYLVKTVFLCQEEVDGRTWEWKWIFLDDGSLIEVSPDGFFRYKNHQIVKQGTSEYEAIVAQDGALVRFEARVREGDPGRRPVHVTVEGKEWRVASTGTVSAKRLGDEPQLIPWQTFSDDASQNVYFGLVTGEDETDMAVGLWTSHVCISAGRELEETNVSGVYRK
jgi:hypothetical protein